MNNKVNWRIGKLLDNRYEIKDVVGVGGMAVVYKAFDMKLKRNVAIKVLQDDVAMDAESRRRFRTEYQAVAMLSHPNIRAVYDGSDAQAKGVAAGDLITAGNGTRVTSIDELNRVKNQFTAGDSITLTLYNGGSYRDVAVILIDQATGQ